MQTVKTQPRTIDGEAEPTTAPKDRIFETLSNPRRRRTLRYLRTHTDETVLIRALAEQIAAWENDVSLAEVTYKQRKRVYTSLYQSHLPKLHRYGFVNYDADRGTIELLPQAEQLDVYLEIVPGGDLPWSDVYLGFAATAVALVVAFWFGALPFATSWHVLVLLVGSFSVLSVAHALQTRRNSVLE